MSFPSLGLHCAFGEETVGFRLPSARFIVRSVILFKLLPPHLLSSREKEVLFLPFSIPGSIVSSSSWRSIFVSALYEQ